MFSSLKIKLEVLLNHFLKSLQNCNKYFYKKDLQWVYLSKLSLILFSSETWYWNSYLFNNPTQSLNWTRISAKRSAVFRSFNEPSCIYFMSLDIKRAHHSKYCIDILSIFYEVLKSKLQLFWIKDDFKRL